MTELTLDITKADWHSANDRLHWAAKAKKVSRIREAAAIAADGLPALQRAHVTAYVAYPRAGRADPANASPVIKAAIDGLVDAGLLPDDDHTHLIGPDYRRDPNTGRPGVWTIRLHIQEVP